MKPTGSLSVDRRRFLSTALAATSAAGQKPTLLLPSDTPGGPVRYFVEVRVLDLATRRVLAIYY